MNTLSPKLVLTALPLVAMMAGTLSVTDGQELAQETQVREFWKDPATSLLWAAKDNGKDVSWKAGIKYCRNLRLGGYSGWRMANLDELQDLFAESVMTPGMAGDKQHYRPFTWHVKGNIFLTGGTWTTLQALGDRGKPSGYVYRFDFNSGKATDDPTGWPYPYVGLRVLCVRGPEAHPVHAIHNAPIEIDMPARESK